MIIRAKNNLDVVAEYSYLSNAEVAGTNVIRVKNINPYSSNWAVQVGDTGQSQAEIVLLGAGAVSGTSLSLNGSTLYSHPADTPVYATKYDKIVFEVSTTGTAGTATPITGGTVTITPNTPYTQFDHTSGATTYAYRVYYLNSVTNGSSSESDWLTSSGFAFYSLSKMRQRVRDKLVNSTYLPDDSVIDDWLNEWLESMTNAAIDVNEGYQMGTTSVSYSPNVDLGTITATDFKQLHRVWYADGSGTYTATKMDSNDFTPNRTFTNTFPYFFMQGDSVIGRRPYDAGGTFVCEYYKLSPVLVNDTDTIPVSMWGYTKSFINYALSQALFKDSKIQESQLKLQEAMADRDLFKREITPRNKTGATYVNIVEDIGSDSLLWF